MIKTEEMYKAIERAKTQEWPQLIDPQEYLPPTGKWVVIITREERDILRARLIIRNDGTMEWNARSLEDGSGESLIFFVNVAYWLG